MTSRAPLLSLALALVASACATTPDPSADGDATASPAPTTVEPCRLDGVAVEVGGHGATGSVAINVRVTNTGAGPCSLQGPPGRVGLRSGGGSLPTEYLGVAWTARDETQAVAPPAELGPGMSASATAVWLNWCLGPAPVDTAWISLPSTDDSVDTQPQPPFDAPRCELGAAPSTITSFAFRLDGE